MWLAQLDDEKLKYLYNMDCRYTLCTARCLPSGSACNEGSAPFQQRGAGPSSCWRSTLRGVPRPKNHRGEPFSPAPCESCSFASRCRADSYECRAYQRWQRSGSGAWKPEHRRRPDAGIAVAITTTTLAREPVRRAKPQAPMPRATRQDLFRVFDQQQRRELTPARRLPWNFWVREPARPGRELSLRVAAAMSDLPATQEASAVEIAIDDQREIAERADARCAVSSIDSERPSDSGQVEIAAQSASYEVSLQTETDSHETIASHRDEVFPTFREAQSAHAREYLTSVLIATGGERAAAARLAGIGRTHMQALVRRFGISIAFDPKARGRHRARRQSEP